MSKLLDTADMELISALKDEQSLSAAADNLHVTRSAVTKRLKKIENVIGMPVICPDTGRKFTDAGKLLLDFSVQTLKKYNDMMAHIMSLRGRDNLIRIMGNSTIMQFNVPAAIAKLHALHVGTEFELSDGSFDEIIKSVIAGTIDIGIVPNSVAIDGLLCLQYKTEQLCVLAHRNHGITRLKSVSIDDIAKHTMIGTSRAGIISRALQSAATRRNLQIKYSAHVKDYNLQAAMIAASEDGAGVTFACVADKWVNYKDVVKVNIDQPWASRNFYVVTKNYDDESSGIKHFLDLLIIKK